MAFDGNEGTWITLDEGEALTSHYRENNPGAIKAYFFGKDKLETLLNQSDSVGIRIYYGLDGDDVPKMVLVGAKENQDDILTNILDFGDPCPSTCSADNKLNS
ncbi:MAG: hypothetical protein ACFB10_15150 [Salibacteraceae bacterium]